MAKIKNENFLSDPRVVQEIERHRWLESEKAGGDIGWDKASSDWLSRFSETWAQFNLKEKRKPGRSAKRA